MKNNIKRIIVVFMTICVIISSFSLTINAAATNNNYYLQEINKVINNERNEVSINNNDYLNIICDEIARGMKTTNSSNGQYIEEYGGMYVDKDGIILYLTKNNPAILTRIENILGYENVTIKHANNSYNYLFDLKTKVTNKIVDYNNSFMNNSDELTELMSCFVGVGIDDANNKLMVTIKDINDDKIDVFKKYILDSDNVIFYNSEDTITSEEDRYPLWPGTAIFVFNETRNTFVRCSMGFRARRLRPDGLYDEGFVTAGHGGSRDDQVYFLDILHESSFVGDIALSTVGGSVDAAFVVVDTSEYELSSYACYTDSQGGVLGKDKIHSLTYFIGVNTGRELIKNGSTTYRTTGSVTSSSYDAAIEYKINGVPTTIIISDCIKSNYNSDDGDSGGIVYSLYAAGDTEYLVVGIHAGGNDGFLGIGRTSITVKISNILSEFGLSFY